MAAGPPRHHGLTSRVPQAVVEFAQRQMHRTGTYTPTALLRSIYLYFRADLHLSKYCLICNVK